jgi:hypothetical protein
MSLPRDEPRAKTAKLSAATLRDTPGQRGLPLDPGAGRMPDLPPFEAEPD